MRALVKTCQALLATGVALYLCPGIAVAAPINIDSTTAVSSSGTPALAFDGDAGSRWESAHLDNEWIFVDLGAEYTLRRATIDWETAHPSDYTLRIRTEAQGLDGPTNPTNWTEVAGVSGRSGVDGGSTGPDDRFDFAGQSFAPLNGIATGSAVTKDPAARYVMMYGTARATPWGHSMYEAIFDVQADHLWLGIDASTAASSTNAEAAALYAFDNNTTTRWASEHVDNQWVYVDLGADYHINEIRVDWETAHSSAYTLRTRTADEGLDTPIAPANWTEIAAVGGRVGVDGAGGVDDDAFDFDARQFTASSGSASAVSIVSTPIARYLMLYGTTRATVYGHSIWELSVAVSDMPPMAMGTVFIIK